MKTITVRNDPYDIYEIICESHGYRGRIHGATPTNRLLLLGQSDVNLRCIVFSYSWDSNRELAHVDLEEYDGINEKNEDYTVRTLYQEEIVESIRSYAEKYIVHTGETLCSIDIKGCDDTVEAVLHIRE